MLGNNLQQTTSAEDIFKCIFSWRFKGKNVLSKEMKRLDRRLEEMNRNKYGLFVKSKEKGQDQESIQSSITPDPGHHMGK